MEMDERGKKARKQRDAAFMGRAPSSGGHQWAMNGLLSLFSLAGPASFLVESFGTGETPFRSMDPELLNSCFSSSCARARRAHDQFEDC